MKNADYWRARFAILEESAHRRGDRYLRELEDIYRSAEQSVRKEIESWYQRFAVNNKLTLTEARRMLTAGQLEEFRWTAEQYVKAAQKANLSPDWIKKLENASARYHVSRLETIQLQIQQQMELLFGNQVDGIDALLREIVSNGYTRGAYEIQKGIGLGWDFTALNEEKLSALLSKPWTTDGRTFRDRCWTNKAELVDAVNKELIQGLLRGDPPAKAITAIQKRFGVSRYKAGRLVHTETTYFNAVSKTQMYRDLGVEQIEIVETLDSRTCEICGPLDGTVIPLSQYEPGVTVPPFHPNCRGTTCPHYGDMDGERAARDAGGKVYYIPADMTYSDWKRAFADGGSKNGLIQAFGSLKKYLAKDGSFDMDAAREDYRNFLQNIPEKNRIYLEQAMDSVEYQEAALPNSPFGYLEERDTVYYDPSKEEFFRMDFAVANTHELSHRIDANFIRSWEDAEFHQAIQNGKAILEKDPQKYIRYSEQNDKEGFLSDILSAVCNAKYEFPMGHPPEYWKKKGNKEKEIFANLFSLEAYEDTEKWSFLEENFPEILKAYRKFEFGI